MSVKIHSPPMPWSQPSCQGHNHLMISVVMCGLFGLNSVPIESQDLLFADKVKRKSMGMSK
jgi:hypothetical protein